MIIYDCEIIKAIEGRKEPRIEGIEYCNGWRDFKGMGISVICAYDYAQDRYRAFSDDNFQELQDLFYTTDIIVGFNNLSFDDRLCQANGLHVPDFKSYDILVEVWRGAGLGPIFDFKTHGGYGLDDTCKANFPNLVKSGHGALAPIEWQKGNIGNVFDYCLNDVRMTKKLLDRIIDIGFIRNPKNPREVLTVRRPEGVIK